MDFPKREIGLYIRRSRGGVGKDNKGDETTNSVDSIVRAWLNAVRDEYYSLHSDAFEDSEGGTAEEEESIRRCGNHRVTEAFEGALVEGRKIGARYVWFATSGNSFLANDRVLVNLVENARDEGATIVAPLLISVEYESSNFVTAWENDKSCSIPMYDDRYAFIHDRERQGCFAVPHVNGSVLVDLQREESEVLTFLPENLGDNNDENDFDCDGLS